MPFAIRIDDDFPQCTVRISNVPLSITKSVLEGFLKSKGNLLSWSVCPDTTWGSQSAIRYQVATATYKEMPSNLLNPRAAYLGDSKLVVSTDFMGLTPLYHPKAEPKLDVIAVTDFDGHAFGSWQSPRKPSDMWLRDYLPEFLPNSRILTYGYDATLFDNQSHVSIFEHAKTLLDLVKMCRTGATNRPLLFLGHGLGGLVVKQALVEASTGSKEDQAILNCTCELLLFGTPTRGFPIEQLVGSTDGKPNERMVKDLGGSSKLLDHLHDEFYRIFNFPDSPVIAFYETRHTPALMYNRQSKRWKRNGPPIMIVQRNSAIYHSRHSQPHDHIGIDENHIDMIRYGSPNSAGYTVVISKLKNIEKHGQDVISQRLKVLGHGKSRNFSK